MSKVKSTKAAWVRVVLLAVFAALPVLASNQVVTSTADGGSGSLRSALLAANSGSDTITFNLAYPATITLTSDELHLYYDVTITGPGASNLTISGGNAWRVFENDGHTVTISGLTLANGNANSVGVNYNLLGGAIYTFGSLTLNSVSLTGNTANEGGAIFAGGTVNLNNCIVSGNSATVGTYGAAGGGIMYNSGSGGPMTITGSIITNNMTAGATSGNSNLSSSGGGVADEDGTVAVVNSTISNNTATGGYGGEGGGIFIGSGTTVTITNSTVSGNSTMGVTSPGQSGGIENEGNATITGSTISNNSADGSAGGILNNSGSTLIVVNSTLTGNIAGYNAGGILDEGTSMALSFVTISGNSGNTYCGGCFSFNGQQIWEYGAGSIKNSIVANSGTSGNCYVYSGKTLTSDGYNLADDTSCATSFNQGTDVNNTPAGLGVLQNNGGHTQTIAPFSTSPATDAIPLGVCTSVAGDVISTDQRGVTRPQGVNCDMGAVEVLQSIQIQAWGADGFGQLGNGATSGTSGVPNPVSILTGPAAISASNSGFHSLALKTDGTVWGWGYNVYGEVGNGTFTSDSPYAIATPTQVVGVGGTGFLTNITAVSAGGNHSVALNTDGTVWTWGENYHGELGNGNVTTSSPYGVETPGQVLGVGGSGFLTGITAIASGDWFNVALKGDGTVWTWGEDYHGELGIDSIGGDDSATPVQVLGPGGSGNLTGIVAIAAGAYHVLALKNDGTVWTWGWNSGGQLGNGSTNDSGTPVQVSGLSGVIEIAGGVYHSMALKSDGTVWAWGNNQYGTVGNGTFTVDSPNAITSPVQVVGVGGTGFLTGIASISAGGYHNMALKSDGTVYDWGYDHDGELGDNNAPTNSDTPVQVLGVGGTGFLTSTVAISGGGAFSLALVPGTAALNSPTIAKAFSPTSITYGGSSTVTLTLSNSNASDLTGAAFTDTLTNMSAVGGAVGGTCAGITPSTLTAAQTSLSFTGITIPANASCTVTFSVTSTNAAINPNTTSGVTTTQTPSAGTVSNTANLTVAALNTPTIAKAFSPTSITYGGSSTVTLTLSNSNASDLTGAAFTDTLTNMSAVGGAVGGTCAGITPSTLAAAQTSLSFTGITIPASASCTVTFNVTSSNVAVNPNATSGVTTTQTPSAGTVSNTASLTVTQAGQTISFAALPSLPLGSAPFTVSATATSGQPVSFGSLTTSVCTVSSATVTLVPSAVGTCTIQATQGGDAGFTAATPVNQSFQVTSAPQLVVTKSMSRSGTISVIVTVTNSGGSAASNVVLTAAKIGTTATTTSLPGTVGTGTIAGTGGSGQITVSFPGTVGTTGMASTLTLSGTYTGGSFGSTARITLP